MLLKPRLLVPLAAGLTFAALAAFIATGKSFAFDSSLVMLMRSANDPSTPLGPAWLREAMRDLTALGSFVALGAMTATASLTLWVCRHRQLAVGLVVSVLAATLTSSVLKVLFARQRPDIVEHAALTFTASFPSGHAFMSAVTLLSIAGFIGLAVRRDDITRLCLFIAGVLTVLIGASRIYLGVHWPTDVIAGWCLGIAWSSAAVAWLGRGMATAEIAAEGARPRS